MVGRGRARVATWRRLVIGQRRGWPESMTHEARRLVPPRSRRSGVDPDATGAYLHVMSEIAPDRGASPHLLAAAGGGRRSAARWWRLAGALWIYYGTAVFFEIVRAGIAACF